MNEAAKKKRRPDLFWAKVNKTRTCWEWLGHITPQGEPQFREGEKIITASRYALRLCGREPPTGIALVRKCRNRSCVRPCHLVFGKKAKDLVSSWHREAATGRGSAQARLLSYLSHRRISATRSEMMDAIDISTSHIGQLIGNLLSHGMIDRPERAHYRITKSGRAVIR